MIFNFDLLLIMLYFYDLCFIYVSYQKITLFFFVFSQVNFCLLFFGVDPYDNQMFTDCKTSDYI